MFLLTTAPFRQTPSCLPIVIDCSGPLQSRFGDRCGETVTTDFGLSARVLDADRDGDLWAVSGATATNHATAGRPGPVSAVPVLPPTFTPEICAFDPVPFSTTSTIMFISALAFAGLIAVANCEGEAV